MSADRIIANHPACIACAAKTRSLEGFMCKQWKLGPSNRSGKHRSFVLGRSQTNGTTLRPQFCPHQEHTVPITRNSQIMLRKLMGK